MVIWFRRWISLHCRKPKLPFHTQPMSHSTNSSIQALVQGGQFTQALELYTKLWNHGFKPDNFTFPYILKASSQLQEPTMGLLTHNHAIQTGFDSNLFVGNSLILFYGRFSRLDCMRDLFEKIPERNIVTWTAAISSYVQNSRLNDAVGLFREMHISGFKPNSFTMVTVLPGFSCSEEARQIHGFLIKCGFESDIFVSTALVNAYAKCGNIFFARQHFNEMPERNRVSWNAMISGYIQNGIACESLKLFAKMQDCHNIQPDSFSIVAALCSCSHLASLRQGKEIHCYVYRASLEREVFIGNGLIDMYGKSGDVELAQNVFDRMQERDVNSWTALITCYGLHGHGTKAISVFEKMIQTSATIPNSVTFTALLTACSYACLVQDGFQYFKAMARDFSIEPTMKHYVCMVDMLGRAGLLTDALKFISAMPLRPDSRVWEVLLGAACTQEGKTAALIAAKQLLQLEPENPELHVQLANVHAKAGLWDGAAKIRGRTKTKNPGLSWIKIL